MPIFSDTSHVQITGGNFVDVGSDFNIESIQPPGTVDIDGVLTGLEFGVDEESGRHLLGAQDERARGRSLVPYHFAQNSGRPLMGAERTERGGVGPRMLPYDLSHRRQILSRSNNSYSCSTSGAPPSRSSFSQYPNGQYPQLEAPSNDPIFSSARESPGEDMHPLDCSASTHPGSESELLSGTHGFNRPQMQNPYLSHYHFSLPSDWQLPALDYPLEWAAYTSSSNATVENWNENHSPDLDADLSQLSQHPTDPIINNNTAFPWTRPQHTPATNISGGTFISGSVNNIQRHGEAGLHILHRAIAGDAFHDSAERYPQPRCHPETRTKLLDVLWNWACGIEPPSNWTSEDSYDEHSETSSNSGSSSENDEETHEPSRSSQDENASLDEENPSSGILWLHGPAGSGKSAVAQSFCQKLKEENRLGGSFFFKRGHSSRGNAKRLFPTIAYQLAILLPELRQILSQTIEYDPAIVDRSLSDQLQELIISPCQKSSLSHPVTVIIDGLDECEGQYIQEEILRTIGNAVSRERVPILFFIASRPESHIRESFTSPGFDGLHRPLNIDQSFQDVRKYLLDEFHRIHREHQTMATVPSPWPILEKLEVLVKKSSGYFIYASTVVKFIDDKRYRPVDRLDIVLGIKSSLSGSPFDILDQLYHQILCAVPIDCRHKLIDILAVTSSARSLRSSQIELLLELERGESVIELYVPEGNSGLLVHHASFLDFLRDPKRSGPFHVRNPNRHRRMAHHILNALSTRRDDLCGLHFSRWDFASTELIGFITATEPSPDLLPLVQFVNPDFIFAFTSGPECVVHILEWLKKFDPRPEDLIQLWEDYQFILLCDESWTPSDLTKRQPSSYHTEPAQVSPQLIKVIHAVTLLLNVSDSDFPIRVSVMLGISWDEMRATICPLRRILGNNKARLHDLQTCIWKQALGQRSDSNFLLLELARGGLRAVRSMVLGRWVDKQLIRGWDFFLRSCPPAHDLLEILSQFLERVMIDDNNSFFNWLAEDFHNVLQWLKTFPHPPGELISRLEHRLQEAIEHRNRQLSEEFWRSIVDLERKWMDWWNKHRDHLEWSTVSA
ncbi:hypothetical protein GGX14DRAFT_432353 [Mycena pura]|uniref:Nephrocystin 3-like N-terminal domain-containing protein n=1 Tax=Mycena pura TaxID=153505 RepID=A0AAD6VVE2_9AGAR|nr:hypothetical protein GGX14DRAFT_432353 [Mycena pura]